MAWHQGNSLTLISVACTVLSLVGCSSLRSTETQASFGTSPTAPQSQVTNVASTDNKTFNEKQQQRIASFEAPVKIDYNAAVPVPRIDNQLITTNGEPENEALQRLLLDPPRDPNQLRGLRFVILATDGVEELELTVPYKFIQERGGTVHLVAPGYQPRHARLGSAYPEKQRQTHIMTVRWMENAGWFPVDRWLSDVKVDEYDALIVPGGTWNPDLLRTNPAVLQFVRNFYQSGKLTTSICHGPWVLVSAGVLKGKRATSNWPIRDDIRNAGAVVIDQPVVVDGNLITSRHPIDLPQYMEAITNQAQKRRNAAQF